MGILLMSISVEKIFGEHLLAIPRRLAKSQCHHHIIYGRIEKMLIEW
jgi:hypothetical protein